MPASKLHVALGGSVLALVAGGARLIHVEGQREVRRSELTALREQLARSEEQAGVATRLRLEVSALTQQASLGSQRLSEQRQVEARLSQALEAANQQRADDRATAEAALRAAQEQAATRRGELEAERDGARELAEQRAEAVAEAERSLRVVRGQLEASQAELTTRQTELDAERERRSALEADLLVRQQALERAAQELRQSLAELSGVEQRLLDERARAEQAERTIAVLREAGVNVGRLSGADPMPDIRAKVVKVDMQAIPPVLLVDVGAQAGITVGDELFVLRDSREVARLEVEDVRERLCSARLTRADRGLELRPGDLVTSRPVRRK